MAVPKTVTFYKGNTQYIEIDGLQDALSGSYFNAATVTATLTDPSGTVVPEVNALTLGYVSSSQGTYRGSVASTFNPTAGGGYILQIVAVTGTVTLDITVRAVVAVRTQ